MDFLRDNGIDIDSAIEILGDIEMVNETMDDFLLEMDDRIPLMEEYITTSDMENYAIIVHAIKGDSKYLGFTKLADMALEHQLRAQDNDNVYVKEHYEELMDEISRIIEVVHSYKDM